MGPGLAHLILSQRRPRSMELEQKLMELESEFWSGDAAFYRANLDDRCLVAFTEMSGVMSREQVAETVKGGRRWADLKMSKKGVLRLGDDVVLMAYEASATSPDGEPYKALVTSGYINREGAWKMAFHQQTPLTKR
jgi:hypothetical protein